MRRKWIIGLPVSRKSPTSLNGHFTSDVAYGTKRRATGIVEQTNSHMTWIEENPNGKYFRLEQPVRIPEFEHLCAVRESHTREMEEFGIPFKTDILNEREVLTSYSDQSGVKWLCYSLGNPYAMERQQRRNHFYSQFPVRIQLSKIMCKLVSDDMLDVDYLQRLCNADFMDQLPKVFDQQSVPSLKLYGISGAYDAVWIKLRQRLWDEGGIWKPWFTEVRDTEGFFEREDVISYRHSIREGR